MTDADSARALGLKVGDTIEGTERAGDWWSIAQLTLLWLGDEIAVWRVFERTSECPIGRPIHEAADWSLDARDWRKVEATP